MKWTTGAGITLIVVGCLAGWIASSPYSDGNRVGTIIKFSHKGFICKTWEGETGVGTSAIGMGTFQTWPFSVRDSKIVQQLEDAQGTGKPVKLHYLQYRFRLPVLSDTAYIPCRMDSEYVVDGVEKIQ